MRIITILGIAAALTYSTYFFVREGDRADEPHAAAPRIEAPSSLQPRREPSSGRAQAQQASTNGKLAELEARLRSVENARDEGAASAEQDQEAASDEPGAPAAARELSEAGLSAWMEETLRVGVPDGDGASQARAEVQAALAQLPGVNLARLDCGPRFCRAAFARDDGARPVLRALFGLPPFTAEGFTIDEPDGRVAVYFTRPGASLNELRSEALAAAAP